MRQCLQHVHDELMALRQLDAIRPDHHQRFASLMVAMEQLLELAAADAGQAEAPPPAPAAKKKKPRR